MAYPLTDRMYPKIITPSSNRPCTEPIPINSAAPKGIISRAMIDAIAKFAETHDPSDIIKIIKAAKKTKRKFVNDDCLAASKIPVSYANSFNASFDVQKGKLLEIKIFIKWSCQDSSSIILTSSPNNTFKVKFSGNGSEISNQFLEAAKRIFEECAREECS